VPISPPQSPSQQQAQPQQPWTQPVSARGGAGSLEDRVARLESQIDYMAEYTAYPLLVGDMTIQGTGTTYVGGITIPWGMLRTVLRIPDDRWDIWIAGWYQSPASTLNVTLYYEDNAAVYHTIVTASDALTAGWKKASGGPYQVRGTYAAANGIPQNEQIWSFGLYASMASQGAANAGTMSRWTMYIRQSPRRS
jgi:hypothetical protein